MVTSKNKAAKSSAAKSKPKPVGEGLHEQLRQMTDEYVEKVMALYEAEDSGAEIIERIYDMRQKLIWSTCLQAIRLTHRQAVAYSIDDLAMTAGQLRAMALAWDGDDSNFRKAEQEHYAELVDFLDA